MNNEEIRFCNNMVSNVFWLTVTITKPVNQNSQHMGDYCISFSLKLDMSPWFFINLSHWVDSVFFKLQLSGNNYMICHILNALWLEHSCSSCIYWNVLIPSQMVCGSWKSCVHAEVGFQKSFYGLFSGCFSIKRRRAIPDY